MTNALNARLVLLMLLPPLMWAGNAIVGRLMVGQASPLTLNFLRWALAVVLLLPLGSRLQPLRCSTCGMVGLGASPTSSSFPSSTGPVLTSLLLLMQLLLL